ncbi:MAG: DUF4132 domain-containing protein [Bacteroidetes bacterium]|nr:MAG: DUF4132 domain-containing protein [Bacteroidota bacterium]TAG89890.1 MAG: DUF4132 domain-containing protein [Bacteroidota bacterium]
MDIYEFLKTKEKSAKTKKYTIAEDFRHELQAFQQQKDYTKLSEKSITLGLLLLNGIPELREDEKHTNTQIHITKHTKAYTKAKKILGNVPISANTWTAHNDLWAYFFGESIGKYIAGACELFKTAPYQEGYYRRSFVAPNMHDLCFEKQLTFLSNCVHYLTYNLTMSEYAIYSNQTYAYYLNMEYIWASAINAGDKAFFELMLDIAYNRHETAKVSQKIIKAMLLSNNVEAWEAIVKLLLAAQRQEGLRQTILECLDETNLGAMKMLIKVILDEKLTRFSSVVRALDVWAGLGWEAQKESTIIRFMEFAYQFLENPNLITEAIKSKDNAEVYMALWAKGVHNIEECYPLIDELLAGNDYEKMILGLYFVGLIGFPEVQVHYFEKILKRPDAVENLAVLAQTLTLFQLIEEHYTQEKRFELFDILEKTLPKVPEKEQKFEGKVFSWLNFSIQKSNVLGIMVFLLDFKNEEEWDKILTYFDKMDANLRSQVTYLILPSEHYQNYYDNAVIKPITQKQRDFALSVLKDRSTSVRDVAMKVLVEAKMNLDEIPVFLEMLTKKSTEVRKTVINMFLKLEKNILMDIIQRLLLANTEQRLAGLDLLIQTKENAYLETDWIMETTKNFVESPKTTQQEKLIADKLLNTEIDVLAFKQENGFGLFNPKIITLSPKPTLSTDNDYVIKTKENIFGLSQTPEKINKALSALAKLIIKHKEHEYTFENWDKTKNTDLLGNYFRPSVYDVSGLSPQKQFETYPLHEVWKQWAEDHKITPLDIMLINLGINQATFEEELAEELAQNDEENEEENNEIENEEQENESKQIDDNLNNVLMSLGINPENSAEELSQELSENNEEYTETNNNQGTHTQAQATEWLDSINQKLEKWFFVPKIPKNITKDAWYNPVKMIMEILPLQFPYPQKKSFLDGFFKHLYYQLSEEDTQMYVKIINNYWYNNEYTWRSSPFIATVYNDYTKEIAHINLNNYEDEDKSVMKELSDEEFIDFWHLENWYFQSLPIQYERKDDLKPQFHHYLRAFQLNLIEKNELFAQLMTTNGISAITQTPKKEGDYDILKQYPFLTEFVDICRNRILEIELKRADTDTAVSHLASSLTEIYGLDYLLQIIVGLGSDKNIISTYGCSYLLKRCFMKKDENQETFNQKIKTIQVSQKRLIEVALYAPYWAKYIQTYLFWENMESAIWWLHAHTNGYHSAETETEIAKYSKIEITEFKDGAVDTKWFQEIYNTLSADKWKLLYDGAKYISDGNGHTRAKLYADVILGNLSLDEVHKRVIDKRNQDYLRVYGLVALDEKEAEKDTLNRYQYLQKFKKESKKFGAQRQASEGLAVRISMDNLARNAGFPDPMRLTWAMETEEAIDIINKAKAVEFGEIMISLVIDEDGKSSLECFKAGKSLKSIPANLTKNEEIIALKAFNTTLQEQYKRTRKSLETAMIAGDEFTISEIQNLMRHPVVSPMLKKLVLKSDNQIGFWENGKLITPNGNENLPKNAVQIAHCTDLFASKEWGSYQKYCFEKEIKQPFKQIFRELYVPTADELQENALSRRYAGHQVQPKKTIALLKSQGWTVNYEEGLQKVFHKEGFIAKIYAMADWFTPSDVESPTLETIEIIDRKTWQNVPFSEINPRIFSEIMRDVDLVVSVAHVGDVDVEASQSSIELRTAIVHETLQLFKITNVELKGTHALIKGTKNEYSVHLGSAIAKKVLGSSLMILPVHSQHRGKMFLPFLDEDPRTAELVSKIILLAKDNEIQDPTILVQLG